MTMINEPRFLRGSLINHKIDHIKKMRHEKGTFYTVEHFSSLFYLYSKRGNMYLHDW